MSGGKSGSLRGLGSSGGALLSGATALSLMLVLGCAHSESYRLASPAGRSGAPTFHQHQARHPEVAGEYGTGSRPNLTEQLANRESDATKKPQPSHAPVSQTARPVASTATRSLSEDQRLADLTEQSPHESSPAGDPLQAAEEGSPSAEESLLADFDPDSPDRSVDGGLSSGDEDAVEDVQLVAATADGAAASKEAGGNSPGARDQKLGPDRQRADRLLERARKLLESGYLDEALRLAQIAENLERSQRAFYHEGEERPSDFVSEFKSASISARDSMRRGGSPATPRQAEEELPVDTKSGVQEVAPTLSGTTDSGTGDVPDAGEPADGSADTSSLGLSGKRFNRSAGRKKFHEPGAQAAVTTQPDAVSLEEGAETLEAPLAEAETSTRTADGAGGPAESTAVDEAAPAPVEIEVSDLPILEVSAPPVPRTVRRYWTWNKVSLTGMVSGLVMLVLLWIWRELERWHYRLTHPA